MKNTKYILILLSVLLTTTAFQNNPKVFIQKPIKEDPPFIECFNNQWVDSVLKSMTLDEKIGQLFMVAAYSNKSQKHIDNISYIIRKYHIGGLIFFQGGPVREAELTNKYQALSKIPLLIAGDWEWGLAMRLDSTIRFPRQMMLGAIQDNKLIYEMGSEIAREIKLIGGHINFAPVIDINNNPANPVIGSRSFGENKYNVAAKGYNYIKALQDNKVLATGKHFPGHGDTDTDSHKALPVINYTKARLDSVELYPFKYNFSKGLGAVMVAHIHIPALDSTPNTATTLSKKVSTDLLKKELGFKGLAFTDALNMKGVSSFFPPGVVDLKALEAGNDILLFPKSVGLGVQKIKEAVKKGEITEDYINERVRKILAVKYWVGLNKYKEVNTDSLYQKLNTPYAKNLKQKLIENAITLVTNKKNIIPLKSLDTLKIASVVFGETAVNPFQNTLKLYANVKTFYVNKFISDADWQKLLVKLKSYNLIIASFHKTNRIPRKNYGISLSSIRKIEELAKRKSVIVDVFANPYVLRKFKTTDNFKAILVSYNDWDLTQKISAQVIFGGIAAKGKLPVSVNKNLTEGTGVVIDKAVRLKYTNTEDAKINGSLLYKIDSIAINSIREKAFPGCQILAAKDGKVFYNKSFGSFTYDNKQKVNTFNIYDLASVTKVAATTMALMKLYEQGRFDFNKTLNYYLPFLDSSNKADILIKDVLTHQARLKPWIPFYLQTIKNDSVKNLIYSEKSQGDKNIQVAKNMYILNSYRDTMYKRIIDTKLRKKKEYKYSDLGFYLMQNIVEIQSGEKLDEFVEKYYYKKLGAYTMGYNPLKKFSVNKIVPTEDDKYFRNQLLQGYVHDMGAAMLGGVAGHAGLFSNANDLAKLLQMLLNGGEYGGVKFLNPETIKTFTSCVYCPDNRRGLGFDKPEKNPDKIGPTCSEASAESFGHTGFTGTMIWADPVNNLIFVFLSNRVYPSMNNKKLLKLNVRTNIQEILYKSCEQYDEQKLSSVN